MIEEEKAIVDTKKSCNIIIPLSDGRLVSDDITHFVKIDSGKREKNVPSISTSLY